MEVPDDAAGPVRPYGGVNLLPLTDHARVRMGVIVCVCARLIADVRECVCACVRPFLRTRLFSAD